MAKSKRNELAAGVFIMVALVGLAAVLVLTGNWEALSTEQAVYHVAFEQLPGIKVGSEVRLHERPIGRVVAIETIPPTDDMSQLHDLPSGSDAVADAESGLGDEYYFVVSIEVPAEIILRETAEVVVEMAPIGEAAWVNIRSTGRGEVVQTSVDNPIAGRGGDLWAAILQAMGFGETEKEMLKDILARADSISAEFDKAAPKITETADYASQITRKLNTEIDPIIAQVKQALEQLEQATEQVDGMLSENREDIRVTVENVRGTVEKLGPQLEELLGKLNGTAGDVQSLVAANRINISETLVNFRQTSEQLKAASLEIRRAPWRLLHKPDKAEADTMNVFDASRTYAAAVADLRSTTATLKTLVDLKQQGVPVDPELMQTMVDRLKLSMSRYDEAEQALWQQWADVQGQ